MTGSFDKRSSPQTRGLERVGELIDTVLSQVAHVEVGPVMRLRRDWPSIAGQWADSSSPVRLSNGTLTIEVATGSVASKLRYATDDLVQNARSALGGTVEITAISVRVARGRKRPE